MHKFLRRLREADRPGDRASSLTTLALAACAPKPATPPPASLAVAPRMKLRHRLEGGGRARRASMRRSPPASSARRGLDVTLIPGRPRRERAPASGDRRRRTSASAPTASSSPIMAAEGVPAKAVMASLPARPAGADVPPRLAAMKSSGGLQGRPADPGLRGVGQRLGLALAEGDASASGEKPAPHLFGRQRRLRGRSPARRAGGLRHLANPTP